MKTRLLIITGIIFISGLIYANSAHALPFISPEYSYENAKHVVIGKVLSVEILSEPYVQKSDNIYSERFGFALYTIQVEDYLKNPLNNSTLNLLGKYTNQRQTRSYETYPYEINQRVLLYIQEIHNIPGYELIISAANSRVIPEEFSSEDVMSRFEYNMSPLKQIQSGISFDEIQCKQNLVLIQKYDGSPACVTEQTKQKLVKRGWTKDDSAFLKINTGCMTIAQSKSIAPFFKVPSYLPEGYSMKCSMSGMPYESYILYHNKDVSDGWMSKMHMLIDDGAIFIHQTDEKNIVVEKFETIGTPEQRIQETYDEVITKNPSLHPQLIQINGMLAFTVDSCNDCGVQTANFTDGTIIQKSTSSEAKIKFIDNNGTHYLLKAGIPLSELMKVAESLQ